MFPYACVFSSTGRKWNSFNVNSGVPSYCYDVLYQRETATSGEAQANNVWHGCHFHEPRWSDVFMFMLINILQLYNSTKCCFDSCWVYCFTVVVNAVVISPIFDTDPLQTTRVRWRTYDREVVGSSLGWARGIETLGKFLTPMCLCSPSSTSWYWPKGGDALRLGSKVRYGWCVGGR